VPHENLMRHSPAPPPSRQFPLHTTATQIPSPSHLPHQNRPQYPAAAATKNPFTHLASKVWASFLSTSLRDWVAAYTVDGVNSGLTIDLRNTQGNLGVETRDGITLSYAAGNTRTPIEYKRVAILTGGTTTTDRAAIIATLKARYGI
jgi:hypothetical protein